MSSVQQAIYVTQKCNMERHVLTVHKGLKPFVCPTCKKPFGCRMNLTSHLKNHRGERNLRCSKCGNRCYRKWDMNYHIATAHSERKEKGRGLGYVSKICNLCCLSSKGREMSKGPNMAFQMLNWQFQDSSTGSSGTSPQNTWTNPHCERTLYVGGLSSPVTKKCLSRRSLGTAAISDCFGTTSKIQPQGHR